MRITPRFAVFLVTLMCAATGIYVYASRRALTQGADALDERVTALNIRIAALKAARRTQPTMQTVIDEPTVVGTALARMPQGLIQKELKDLKVGEHCYTVPWAMWVDSEGNCWLNPNYSAYDGTMGTVQMSVAREKAGYVVNVAGCADHGWNRNGQRDEPWIPVVRLLGAK